MSANSEKTPHVPDWILWLLSVGLVFALGALLLMAGILDGPPPSDSEPAASVPEEATPEPTSVVEPTPEPTAMAEPKPEPTATVEPTVEATATLEPIPEPTVTPEPIKPIPTPEPTEPIPAPQPTVIPEPTATPEPQRQDAPWLDWTFDISHPIYMPKIGEVVELHTGGKFVIHEIMPYEGSESELTRVLGLGERIVFIEIQAWNPADPTVPSIATLLTIEAVYGENVYGDNAVWFLRPVSEERVTGGPAYANPTEPDQTARGWMGVVVPSEASLRAIVWIIFDFDGDNDAIMVWLLEPGLY
jgi:hypothetical protein